MRVAGNKRSRTEAELEPELEPASKVATATPDDLASTAPSSKRVRRGSSAVSVSEDEGEGEAIAAIDAVEEVGSAPAIAPAPAIVPAPPIVAYDGPSKEAVAEEQSQIGLYFSLHVTRPDGSFTASSEKWTVDFADELSFSQCVDTLRRFAYHVHLAYLMPKKPSYPLDNLLNDIAASSCKTFVEVVLDPHIKASKTTPIDPKLQFFLSSQYGLKGIKGVIKQELEDPKTALCFNTTTNGEAQAGSFAVLNKGFVLRIGNESKEAAVKETKALLLITQALCDSLIGPECIMGRYDDFSLPVIYVDPLGNEILRETVRVPKRPAALPKDSISFKAQTLELFLGSFRSLTEQARDAVLASQKTTASPGAATSTPLETSSSSAASAPSEPSVDHTRAGMKRFFNDCWCRIGRQSNFFPKPNPLLQAFPRATPASADPPLPISESVRANAVIPGLDSSLEEGSAAQAVSLMGSASVDLGMMAAASLGDSVIARAEVDEGSASHSGLAPSLR